MTNENDRATLLKIARDAVTAHATGVAQAFRPAMDRFGGAFVTIHHRATCAAASATSVRTAA